MEVNITNKGDPAYEAKVFFVFPLSIRFIDIVNKTVSEFYILIQIILFFMLF